MLQGENVGYFPDLTHYRIFDRDGEHVLVNKAVDGSLAVHRDLVFHGGQGEALEMRVFCQGALIDHFTKAGFVDVRIMREDAPRWGILHKHP